MNQKPQKPVIYTGQRQESLIKVLEIHYPKQYKIEEFKGKYKLFTLDCGIKILTDTGVISFDKSA